MIPLIKNLICKIFGHSMYFDSTDICGPSTCKICGHKESGIEWTPIPMPKCKEPRKECQHCGR